MTAGTLNVRVTAKSVEATNICSFELADANGAPLPPFSGGSHIDVHLPGGITRQYSLCNDPTESHRYLIGVLLDPASRGGSRAMHALKVGDRLQISPPKNHFPLAHDARCTLLLAGGIGITPILCMAERLAMTGADFELHYSTRSRERTAFFGRIMASAFAPRVVFHFDDGAPEQKLNLAGLVAHAEPGLHLYVCGPKGLIDAALATARHNGWPEAQLHYEFFSAKIDTSGDQSFYVKLARSGRIVHVPKDRTVARALADAGIDIELSCEQGVCGTCLTRVLEGIPDHKDCYLTSEEQAANDQFTPCCSRSKTRMLVLDL